MCDCVFLLADGTTAQCDADADSPHDRRQVKVKPVQLAAFDHGNTAMGVYWNEDSDAAYHAPGRKAITIDDGPYGPSDGGDWREANEQWVKEQVMTDFPSPGTLLRNLFGETEKTMQGQGMYSSNQLKDTNPPDMVNHPPHYTAHESGVECIEIVRWMPFNVGNAVKYCWRAGKKGSTVEDLKKAIWYLEDEIKRLESS